MDSKIVTKELRRSLYPLLKEHGFEVSGRNAWRYTPKQIQVVNFQSFNDYLASGVGCTTYSFAVKLGCYFLWIEDRFRDRLRHGPAGQLRPSEAHCQFRRSLQKGLYQPQLKRAEIWYVSENPAELASVVHDARMSIFREAFSWFERLSDVREVARTLKEDDEDLEGTWGFGRNPCPKRHYQLGYTLVELNELREAGIHLSQALQSDCYSASSANLEATLERIRGAA